MSSYAHNNSYIYDNEDTVKYRLYKFDICQIHLNEVPSKHDLSINDTPFIDPFYIELMLALVSAMCWLKCRNAAAGSTIHLAN